MELAEKILKRLRGFIPEAPEEPLYWARFRWWRPLNLDLFIEEYGGEYEVEVRPEYFGEGRIEIHHESRREVRISADTIRAFLTCYRGILFQKEIATLTEKDRTLIELILENYPHNRETPFI